MHKIILIIIAMVVNQSAANQGLIKQGIKNGQTAECENSKTIILKWDLEVGYDKYTAPYNNFNANIYGTSLELFTNFKTK